MNRLAILIAALFAPAAFAQTATSTPSNAKIRETMTHDVVYTAESGFVGTGYNTGNHPHPARFHDAAEVSITLKRLIWPNLWTHFGWEAELLLPDGVTLKAGQTNPQTSKGRTDVVSWTVLLDDQRCHADPCINGTAYIADGAYRVYKAAIRVKLRPAMGMDSHLGAHDGTEYFRYPVLLRATGEN